MTDRGAIHQSVWTSMMRTTFCQAYVEADGIRTRYVDSGPKDAPAVIMLHGTGGHWETFCRNIPVLSESFRCIAVDMMGCGFNDKPDKPYLMPDYVSHLTSFMDVLGLKTASIIGVSLGSWVAAAMAQHHPDRVDKLVFCSPSGYLKQPPAGTGEARRNSAQDPSWENIRTVLTFLVFDENSMMDDMIAVRQAIYSLPNMVAIMPRLLTLMNPEARASSVMTERDWNSIKAPALIVKAVDVEDNSSKTADALTQLMQHPTLLEMPKTAHWPHYEDPATFNSAVTAFLKDEKSA